MLRTNSKKTRENIRKYVIDHIDYESYGCELTEPTDWVDARNFVLTRFRDEKYSSPEDYRYYHRNELEAFIDWCQGLPSALDTCYYYNRPARDDLGDILEENEAERSRYDEWEAEELLTKLIYRELIKEVK